MMTGAVLVVLCCSAAVLQDRLHDTDAYSVLPVHSSATLRWRQLPRDRVLREAECSEFTVFPDLNYERFGCSATYIHTQRGYTALYAQASLRLDHCHTAPARAFPIC